MDILSQYLGILNLLLLICAAVGGYFAVRHARKAAIIAIQDQTIKALQDQIDALKDKVDSLDKENVQQRVIIETIQEALKQRGIIVTIDGDLVTISDIDGTHSMRRRGSGAPVVPPPQTPRKRRPFQKPEDDA